MLNITHYQGNANQNLSAMYDLMPIRMAGIKKTKDECW